MQYRDFGKLDWKVSALGFGCMRLPTAVGQPTTNILEDEAVRMIRHAIDNGVNYLDTARPYHGGQSEILVGKALLGGYRDRVKLATKLPVWMVKGPEDFDRILGEQLQQLQTDHIDCYLFHGLNRKHWREIVLKHNLLEKAEVARADGRIRHIGFSFHDEYEGFEEIVNGSDLWSFCQIQYNFMDTEKQAGVRGLKLAAAKGLAVVIMEPLLGGKLADPPQEVRETMAGAALQRSPAEWALQWIWDQPEVSVVLSGMSTMAQVEENLASADRSLIHSFGESEQAMIVRVVEQYRARAVIPCTHCNYCMPCPNGVNVPGNFDLYNFAHLYNDAAGARMKYQVHLKDELHVDACIACGTCEEQCPQKIAIREWLPKVAAMVGVEMPPTQRPVGS